MKKFYITLIISLFILTTKAQTLLLQETFQDWTAEPGLAPIPPSKSPNGVDYSFTKMLFDGKTEAKFESNSIIVEPEKNAGNAGKAEGNGNPSNGRIALKGAKNYLQLPELPSVGKVIIKASVGTDLKEFKLQASAGSWFDDIAGTTTSCSKEVIKEYIFDLNYSKPTTLRIVPTSGSAVYIWDIQIYSSSNK
jgi:hypothetical protein